MKNVRLLIIAYYFPPAAGGGIQRMLKLAKYLPAHGVDVHVLTPNDPLWHDRDPGVTIPTTTTVHRSRYRGFDPRDAAYLRSTARSRPAALRRRVGITLRRFAVPDVHVGWATTAIKAGTRVVREHAIDVVLSTSPPPTDHLVGHAIAKRTQIPWIADFRDSWLAEPKLRLDSRVVRTKLAVNSWIARHTVGHADRIITVSQPLSHEMATRYPQLAQRDAIRTVMNGVDLDDVAPYADINPVEHSGRHCTLLYTGNFHGDRSPRPILESVLRLLDTDPSLMQDVRLHFVGSLKDRDLQWINANTRLQQIVHIEPFKPYAETLALQRQADALLLIIAAGPNSAGEVTGKVFEYLAARRPILAVIPPSGAAAQLLAEVPSVRIAPTTSPESVDSALRALVSEWRATNRSLPDLEDSAQLHALISRKARAGEVAAIIHELVGT